MQFKSSRVFIALVAVFAISAVTAASASAYTNPILVNSKGEHVSKVKFTGEDQEQNTPIAAPYLGKPDTYQCSTGKTTGELSTTGTGAAAVTSGTATTIFTHCKIVVEGNMTQKGKTKTGEIESKVALSLVWIGKESEEKPGVREAIVPMSEKSGNGKGTQLELTVGTTPFNVEGAFITSFNRKLGEEFTSDYLTAAEEGEAKQRYKKYTEEGKEGENTLFSSWDGSTFEESAARFEEEQAYAEKVKIAKS
jgi:hypothetical protein